MDFRAVIANELANGVAPEDLAKAFAETLNEAEAVNKSQKERDDFVNSIWEAVKYGVTHRNWGSVLAAQVLTLAAADRYDDWTKEDLQQYNKVMAEAISDSAQSYNDMVKHPPKELQSLFDVLESVFGGKDKSEGEDADDVKLKRFVKGLM